MQGHVGILFTLYINVSAASNLGMKIVKKKLEKNIFSAVHTLHTDTYDTYRPICYVNINLKSFKTMQTETALS